MLPNVDRTRLAALIALGLTRLWLPGEPVPRIGDARVIAQGRFHLWSGWDTLPEADQRLGCRFRLLARGTIEIDASFRSQALAILTQGEEFSALDPLPAPTAERKLLDEVRFDVTPGGQLRRSLDVWMAGMEAHWTVGRLKVDLPGSSKKRADVQYARGRTTYSIPKSHIPPAEPWPRLDVAAQVPVGVDVPALLAFATRLDEAARGRGEEDRGPQARLRRADTLASQLLGPMRVDGAPIGDLTPLHPGRMALMLAPTGTGKSVFSQVAALHWASQGIGVALVVPRIADVMKTTRQLEGARDLLQLPLDIVPMSSPGRRFEAVAQAWQRSGPLSGEGAWAVDRLGYHCALQGYAHTDTRRGIRRGQEPCTSLSPGTRPSSTRLACPFLGRCDLHRQERQSTRAQILVLNHHNFLLGTTRTPMGESGTLRRRSVMELTLARCQVVVIDEVDEFQKVVIDRDSGSLDLSSRGGLSLIHRIFRELEEKAAELPRGLRARDERVRRDLALIQILAQELTHLLGRNDVTWPFHPRLRWSQSSDADLCQTLFGATGDRELRRFDSLFQDDVSGIRLADHERDLKTALAGWVEVRHDDHSDNHERCQRLRDVIQGWPWPRGEPSAQEQAAAAHLLILRATLRGLEGALDRLRMRYPDLADHDLPGVSELREALEWHGLPTISPLGALGRQVYGFSRREDTSRGEGPLRGLALQGSPHEDVSALGDTTALGLVGVRRVVLGISATAWFPGSPLCDVQGRLRFVRPDDPGDNPPRVSLDLLPIHVGGTGGEAFPVSISGLGDATLRRAACQQMGSGLAPVLRAQLGEMEQDPAWAHQARALIVTGSYLEAMALAQGLLMALKAESQPAAEALAKGLLVVRGPATEDVPVPEAHLLDRRDIESLPTRKGRILVAPLSIVARGHNILAPGTDRSAIGAIYVAVRPVPPLDNAARVLAHVSAMRPFPPVERDLMGALEAERRQARGRFLSYLQQARPFSQLKEPLRNEVLSDVLVELAQLAGRARRGGTAVRVYLIDGSFTSKRGSWPNFLRALLRGWQKEGLYDDMERNHGAFVRAIAQFCNFKPIGGLR